MGQACAEGVGDVRQREDLVFHRPCENSRGHRHRDAPEPGAIRIAGMRSDRNAVSQRVGHGLPHRRFGPGVPAARDVRRADERIERLFAGPFTDIGVYGDPALT